jgi:5-keto 4-deoxyuronate isomerase
LLGPFCFEDKKLMGTYTRAHTFTSGELLTSANLNGELNGIVSVINGSIDGANVDATAIPTLTGTQTLTNKTLTSPKIGTNILDTNGNELVVLTATGSAVNEVTLANAATGNSPTLTASGGDANIDLTLAGKGTGKVVVTGDLQISGDDLFMATNTAGYLLIGDGTNYNPTALSGDVSVNSSGVTAIGSGVIVDADVNASAAIAQSKLNLAVTTSEIAASTLVVETEGIGANDNDTTIPTSAAVKAYVDTNITAQDFDFTTSSGSGAVDLDSQALAFTPGEGVNITHTGQAVTIAAEDATTSNKGVASFATADFSVSSGAVSLQDLTTSHIAAATLVVATEGIGSNDNDTTLPTSAAVKAYVDTNVTAQDLDFTTDSGSGAVDLDSQALAFTSGEGVDITHTGQAVTIAGEDATDANKGVASFASADFSVSSGAVSLVDLTTSHLAAATLVTATDTIAGNDNDTTLPRHSDPHRRHHCRAERHEHWDAGSSQLAGV